MSKSYIEFVYVGKSKSGITKQWYINTADGQTALGTIRWSGQWRKYCFFPASNTQFDASCLLEITMFLNTRTKDHGKISDTKVQHQDNVADDCDRSAGD